MKYITVSTIQVKAFILPSSICHSVIETRLLKQESIEHSSPTQENKFVAVDVLSFDKDLKKKIYKASKVLISKKEMILILAS